jgi:hypothetical protein
VDREWEKLGYQDAILKLYHHHAEKRAWSWACAALAPFSAHGDVCLLIRLLYSEALRIRAGQRVMCGMHG